jgi:hypothetical protein
MFELKYDRDLIFKSGPYFMGSRGMYLNHWTLGFSIENEIPSAVPFSVYRPFFPFHCWNGETMRRIGNTLGQYIDYVEP